MIAVSLEELTAVYHRASAMTHVLIEPAPQIIETLQRAALTLIELSAALDLEASDEAVLAERLAELEESGLVARA